MASLPSSFLEQLLAEDVPDEDLTTLALGIGAKPARMSFVARGEMVVAGIEVAADLIQMAGAAATVEAPSGQRASPEALLLTAEGTAAALLRGWKVAQTLVEVLSGIATAARAVVDAVEAVDKDVRVACTRKTVPGARRLSHMAIRAGGAIPHRFGLSDSVLVFPEHRTFLKGEPLPAIAARLRRETPEKKLVIEVGSIDEALEAIAAGFEVIQLEKFEPDAVAAVANAASAVSPTPRIATAGGISPQNAGAYVQAGARLIVTSWPYTARPADVAVSIT